MLERARQFTRAPLAHHPRAPLHPSIRGFVGVAADEVRTIG
jgi:hypothetical protein